MDEQNRFFWPVRPVSCIASVVAGQKYRFTVLTSRLIRMEYCPSGIFEDRASQSVFYRDFPEASFTFQKCDGVLTLETEYLTLIYRENEPFCKESLAVALKREPASCWHYGEDFEDLGGTARTLDEANGAIPMGRGVCSRNGFSVLDDSETMVLDSDGWVAVRRPDTVDSYFFGYGYDYVAAVQDLYRLTGLPPMLPAYALGNWWSRYHAYTQQEYCDLMDRFRREDIPFSVGVVDMDWHIVDIPEEDRDPELPSGWTGYTWNKALFPDYKAFLKYLKDNHLHTALNLHPAEGVRRHESMYPEMAKASGIDPASGKRVPLDILSKEHMANYFDIIHHPYEAEGVDFWWMDWQQGTDYWWIHEPNAPGQYQDPRERMDPLWMLNHQHILDISRNGKRPMFFSRFVGPGSHRYPVGFSGDTTATWESLKFQPYFTAAASNVGYSWWSHDIGGHMMGYRDDELAVRWIQFGVFSPIMRLHSTNNNYQRKEPWSFGKEEGAIMGDWLRLRHSLFPYIYTMNRRTATQGLPLIQPMYYSHPKCNDAYRADNQYWFGSELIAAPITEKNDAFSRMGSAPVWLPKGQWFDFFTGLRYASARGRNIRAHRYLDTMPLFAKAGAIVPMAVYPKHENRLLNADTVEVLVFPGASNAFTLYEDVGEYSDYTQGAYAETKMSLSWGSDGEFVIEPARGDLSLIPGTRTWKIGLRGFHKEAAVSVTVDGNAAEAGVSRDPETNTIWIRLTCGVTEKITVSITGRELTHDNGDVLDRCDRILQLSQICTGEKEELMRLMTSEKTLHKRLVDMVARSRETAQVTQAIKELLTLTEDEYLGKQ